MFIILSAFVLFAVSLNKIQPAVSRLWGAAKAVVVKTPARPLVCNIVVSKVESVLDRIAGIIVSGITTLRNKQLPREAKYLERELDKVKQRMSSGGDNIGSDGGRCPR